MAHGPYSRLYHELADDYPEVYDSPLLADFSRLLVASDQSYPTMARWSGHASRRAMNRLSSIGLDDDRGPLITMHGARFELKGHAKERGGRTDTARRNATARWGHKRSHSDGNATAMQPHSNGNARRDETSKDETRRDEHSAREDFEREGLPHITPIVQAAGEAITGHGILTAGDKQLTELDRLIEDHGPDAVIAGFGRVANGGRKSWRQLVWDTTKALEPLSTVRLTPEQAEKAEVDANLRAIRAELARKAAQA